MKKIISYLLAATLLVTVAGCSDNTLSTESDNKAVTDSQSEKNNTGVDIAGAGIAESAAETIAKTTEESEPVDEGKWVLTKEFYYSGEVFEKGSEYEYDELGRLIKETEYNEGPSNGEVPEYFKRMEYTYDDSGHAIVFRVFYNNRDYRYWHECEYDEQGRKIKVYDYHHTDEKGDFLYDYEVYEYFNNGQSEKVTSYEPNHEIKSWTETEYDEAGNKTRIARYKGDGCLKSLTESVYDKQGNITEFKDYDSDGVISEWYSCEYDDGGNETKHIIYNEDGEITTLYDYEYNDAGNVNKTKCYRPDGSVVSRSEYKYDAAGNMIQYTKYSSDGSIIENSEKEYDEAGNMIRSAYYIPSESISTSKEYEYDAEGNMIKITAYNGESVTGWSEYEYDAAGNKMHATSYDSEGIVDYVEEYEYLFIPPKAY